jgi:hypothetical protein
MPAWGNTDTEADKPHFPRERLVRLAIQTTAANTGTLGGVKGGNTVIRVADVTGITVGQFVYDAGVKLSTSGENVFFKSNNTVLAISASNVVLTNAVTADILNGAAIYFANTIVYATNTNGVANTVANVFSDTILVTAGRLANTQGTTYGGGSTVANTKLGNGNAGWNLIQRKINNDGTVRFLKETLVAMSSPVASNVSSANTSANAIFGGL